jgi:hypothetical protein
MKFAFVVSEIYPDLYVDTLNKDFKSIVFSSQMRSGPISLFTDLNSDFLIIKNNEFSTKLWEEKYEYCGLSDYNYYISISHKTIMWNNITFSKSDIAVSASNIDWSVYDYVICVDACVSPLITSIHPNVVWAYYVSEGGMPEALNSRIKPYDGYSVFLNQRFRRDDYFDDPNSAHEIDFPYHLMSTSSMRKLLGDSSFANKSGVFVEKDSRSYLFDEQIKTLEKFGPVRLSGGNIEYVLKNIAASKYFLRLGDKSIWGNASIEAAACETLLISSERGYRNRIFCFSNNSVGGIEYSLNQFDEAVNKIENFESNNSLYLKSLLMQSTAINEVCFNRPISKLLDKKNKLFSFPS